jgi:hypothetical protein
VGKAPLSGSIADVASEFRSGAVTLRQSSLGIKVVFIVECPDFSEIFSVRQSTELFDEGYLS